MTTAPEALETTKLSRGYLHPFWNGGSGRYLYGVGELPRTLTELAMCQLSATIRRTDGWWTKLNDPAWRCHWNNAARNTVFNVRTSTGLTGTFLSQKHIEYVLDELEGYRALRDADANCEVSCFDRIWETSAAHDPDSLHSLQQELNVLRTTPPAGTHCRNIVNPYLYPLVYGRTLVRDRAGHLVPAPRPPFAQFNYTISDAFACLPTPFAVSAAGPLRVRARAYINGVPPWQHALVRGLEGALARGVPLLERVLTDLHRANLLPHRIPGTCRYTTWDEPLTPEHSDDEDGWATYQRELRAWALSRPIQYPDVSEEGYPGGLEERRVRVSLRGRTVKVIVKVSDIHIHPNHPTFDGTPWHAEGMRNERIVASTVQCLSMSNVTPISLAFRMPVRAPVGCAADDEGATIRTWGLRMHAPSHQFLGTAALHAGHAVAWPNIYQHRYTDVRLEDATRPGMLTLLHLHLVDPELPGTHDTHDNKHDSSQHDSSQHDSPPHDCKNDAYAGACGCGCGGGGAADEVPATDRVPPQDAAWVRAALEAGVDARVPSEILERIMAFAQDALLGAAEAGACAHAMREERVRFWKEHNQLWFSLPFAGFEN